MEQKQKDIWLYSNPDTVKRRVIRYLPEGFEQYLFVSTRKNSKYMILNPQGKWIHFGRMGMEDYTKHGDEQRLMNFRKRNKRWANAAMFSPAYLSYYLLW